jgi:Zn-dependent metalloprotease
MVGLALRGDEVTPTPRARRAGVRAATAAASVTAVSPTAVRSLDPEAAARQYLDRAMTSAPRGPRAAAAGDAGVSEYRSLGAEAVPLTGTTMVKFRQTFNKIPVYGSLVTVELDEKNRCVGVNSSIGAPSGVQHIAKISPAQALAVAAKASGQPRASLRNTPLLYYYFHPNVRAWRLAYIVEDVPQGKKKLTREGRRDAVLKDYVVDANTGRLLAELPRTSTLAAVREVARDGTRANRTIVVESVRGGGRELRDDTLKLRTCDFSFRDPWTQSRLLPGNLCVNPPQPWPAEAVGAHFNGAQVARFLRGVLKRNNIDNKGGVMLSSVNCWDRSEGQRPARQWSNAYWNGDQMVYGQIKFPDGTFYSIANMLDIVGHEMFHGVTDHTARLEYQTQAGALNESYSDIFGILIANAGKPIQRWKWNIGTGWYGPGTVLRSMSDPTRHEQPKHMRDFMPARPPYDDDNDNGEVHGNSGIHNYAAYRAMTAKHAGRYVFTAKELAALYYVALTQHLSRTSQFSDSRRAVLQAAGSLFRKDAASVRDRKVKAIEDAFDAVGIA